jgi:CBS domain-containing protein
MKVKDIMTKDVKFIKPTTLIQEAAKIMREEDVGALPVGDNDRLVGMITDRDIVIRALIDNTDIKGTTVERAISSHCLYCFEDDSIEDLSNNMAKNQVRRLPVLNQEKRLVGIVSLCDLVSRGSKETAAEALSAISKKNI